MIEKIAVGITGINILLLVGVFISLKYWNTDWFKKLRKFYSEEFSQFLHHDELEK